MISVETANRIIDLWSGSAPIASGGEIDLGAGCILIVSHQKWFVKCESRDLRLYGQVMCVTDRGGRIEFSLSTGSTDCNDAILSFSVKVGA